MSNSTSQITFTPSDLVGAVKQGCEEILRYLCNTPVTEVNGAVAQAHLERLGTMIGMVAPVAQSGAGAGESQAYGGRPEGRAN